MAGGVVGGPPNLPLEGLVGANVADFWEEYAFWAEGLLDEDILAAAHDAIRTSLADGLTTPADLITALDGAMGEFLPELDSAGRVVNVPHRLETIARTNLATAMQTGRMAAFSDPDLAGFVTGFQYSAILDSRVRENHAAWDGVVRDAEFWNAIGCPPSGWNCRCSLSVITPYDGVEMTADSELPGKGMDIPDEGFIGRGGARVEEGAQP